MSELRRVVEVIARALADRPTDVHVVEAEHRGTQVLDVHMAPGDLGRVIGRQGRTAAAMRTLVTLAGEHRGVRTQLEFRDGPPRR